MLGCEHGIGRTDWLYCGGHLALCTVEISLPTSDLCLKLACQGGDKRLHLPLMVKNDGQRLGRREWRRLVNVSLLNINKYYDDVGHPFNSERGLSGSPRPTISPTC